ncbi:MAG: 4-vinyl reductase [Candidatus Thermoplasmatota archaeon]
MAELSRTGGFAEALAVLGKLTRIEGAVTAAIAKSKVPRREVRMLLTCSTPDEAMNTPLYQYLRALFEQIGLGTMEIAGVDIFNYGFKVEHCPICRLYPNVQGRVTCYVTADTLTQFFTKDMGIPSEVEETKCMNKGDGWCEFAVSMQPLSVYQFALDKTDRAMITRMVEGDASIKAVGGDLGLSEEEMDYRTGVLRRYHILNPRGALTEIGETYCRYAQNFPIEEEDFPPPWHRMSEISGAIAASMSFAEAFTETAESEPIYEVKEEDVVNLVQKAKSSKSFAELLSKQMIHTEDDEGG